MEAGPRPGVKVCVPAGRRPGRHQPGARIAHV